MEHIYHKCSPNIEQCYYCNHGFAHCEVCNGTEGELTTDCRNRQLKDHEMRMINNGGLDFKDGIWYIKDSHKTV